jgi:uncharacterized membrane protein
VLGTLVTTLGLGAIQKAPCALGPKSFALDSPLFCASDVPYLYTVRSLNQDRAPYLETPIEYPVVTGITMWLVARPATSPEEFFVYTAILLATAAFGIAFFLFRLVGRRALYFTLAPTLLLYAFVNWDLLAVLCATAATYAFLKRRDGWAGILIGVGAAAKLYPALLLVPFVLERLHERRRQDGLLLVASSAASWVALNLPFMLLARTNWWLFFRFNSVRPPDLDSFWFVGCQRLTGNVECSAYTRAANIGSIVLLILSATVIWRLKRNLDPNFQRWTFAFPLLVLFLLTSKVYSPQYGLWLLPWFALVLPNPVVFAAFEAADIAVFVSRFSHLGWLGGGLPIGVFECALVLRGAILVWALYAWVRQGSHVRLVGLGMSGSGFSGDPAHVT